MPLRSDAVPVRTKLDEVVSSLLLTGALPHVAEGAAAVGLRQLAVDRVEHAGDLATERRQSDDRGERDQGEDQCVLDEGLALFALALILALVSLAAVVALTTLGGKITGVFNSINSKLP